jgi:hypothetical protein
VGDLALTWGRDGDLVGELGHVGSKADDAKTVSARDADDDSDVS